jgi:hypothetical protein
MVRTSTRPRRNSPLNLDSASALFKRSARIVRRNGWIFGTLYGYQMIFLLNSWITNPDRLSGGFKWQFYFQNHNFGWVLPTLPPYSWGFFTAPSFFSLVMLAISFVFFVLTFAAQLEASKHRSTPLDTLWKDTRADVVETFKLVFVLTAIVLAPSLAAIFAGHAQIGAGLLVLLGVYVSRRYLFAPYVIIEEKIGFREAMQKSRKLSDKYPGSVWSILFLSAIFGLTSFIPLVGGLLSFALAYLFAAAPALRYEQLKLLSA